jgi:Cof subfamily protein (haloacid dehalogenase superfamily)
MAFPLELDHRIRLVVSDMDGTLLTSSNRVPDALWPILEELRANGILFVPASGRQYSTLHGLFERAIVGMPVIAGNGSVVIRDGVELSSSILDGAVVSEIVRLTSELAAGGADVGVVLCGKFDAYVSRHDRDFLDAVGGYCPEFAIVDDLLAVGEEVTRIAIYAADGAEDYASDAFGRFARTHQVSVSSARWIDISAAGVTKGTALSALQTELGISRAETMAFGDYLNDLEMLEASQHSFAMDDAHPAVKFVARHIAPSNSEDGVIQVLDELLRQQGHQRALS